MDERNCLAVLGPTASGKTRLAVRLAEVLNGTILSVDSRQVYRGLDIGAGKDLSEYVGRQGQPIPHRLIDVVDLNTEYNVFDFQNDFYTVFDETLREGRLPVAVGGTGLYLEAVLEGYRMDRVERNEELRADLETFSNRDLEARLRESKKDLHNTSDLGSRDRMIRAIEIAEAAPSTEPERNLDIQPVVLGVEWERSRLRERIGRRLKDRLREGLIEEVEGLHGRGVSWERLEGLGLEYRYVSRFLRGEIPNLNDLFQKLHSAINQFSKRQVTWFRRMEKRGTKIHWIPEGNLAQAQGVLRAVEWKLDSKSIS